MHKDYVLKLWLEDRVVVYKPESWEAARFFMATHLGPDFRVVVDKVYEGIAKVTFKGRNVITTEVYHRRFREGGNKVCLAEMVKKLIGEGKVSPQNLAKFVVHHASYTLHRKKGGDVRVNKKDGSSDTREPESG